MNPETQFVRLSCPLDETYVYAADDGRSVRIDARQASYNAVWRVEQHLLTDGQDPPTPHILFCGVYGRYLGALDTPSRSSPRLRVVAAQHDFDEPEVRTIMWKAILKQDELISGISLQSATGSYLENVSAPRGSFMARVWRLEICPSLARPQPVIDAKPKWVKLLSRLQWRRSLERDVKWVVAADDGSINEGHWGTLPFTGRDISCLEKEIGKLVELPTTLCVRAGRYGQPTPLCINLPSNNERLTVILFLNGTARCDGLRYPDVNHGVPQLARHGNRN